MTAERIRDKIAAEKRRGKYLGGVPPLGYKVDRDRRRLVVVPAEAVVVRQIFRRFLQLGSAVALIKELNENGHRTKAWVTKKGKKLGGFPWNKSHVYRLLDNPIYIGRIRHKEATFAGQHDAIIEHALWDDVQRALAENTHVRSNESRAKTPALLRGIIRCGACGRAMGITFTRKEGRTYRYYLCVGAAKSGYDACPVRTVPAGDVEKAVMMQVRRVFQAPEILSAAFAAIQSHEQADRGRLAAEREALEKEIATMRVHAQRLVGSRLGGQDGAAFLSDEIAGMERTVAELNQKLQAVNAEFDMLDRTPTTETGLLEELQVLDRIWDELFPAEREHLIRLVVDRLTVNPDGLVLALRAEGLGSLLAEMGAANRDGKRPATPASRRDPAAPRAEVDADAGRITLHLPMKFKKSGGRKKVILPDGAVQDPELSPVQVPLAIAVARAHRWLRLLEEGKFASISELAEAVGMDPSQLRRHLNLTLLSPAMVRRILDGAEPEGMSMKGVGRAVEWDWASQTLM